MAVKIIIDPNPCLKYPWKKPCAYCYSGAHCCDRGNGHSGACRCANCGKYNKSKKSE